LLHLQRTAGNGSVSQLLASARTEPVVQRAVGFEFEDPSWTVFKLQPGRTFRQPGSWFSWGNVAPGEAEKTPEERSQEKYPGKNVYQGKGGNHINGRVGDFNLQTGPKKGALHAGKGFDAEPDGPYSENGVTNRMDLEFVTKPFPETQEGFAELLTALDDMQVVYNRINGRATGAWDGEDFDYDRFVKPQEHQFSDQEVFLYGGVPGGDFKPQVTAGTDLADVPELMETLGSAVPHEPGKTDEHRSRREKVRSMVYGQHTARRGEATLMGNTPNLAAGVGADLVRAGTLGADADGMDALQGFLSLAIMYVSALSERDAEGIKVRLPLLSRHSFVTLFQQLPEGLRNALKAPNGRVALITAMSRAIAGKVKGPAKTMAGPMISVGNVYTGPGEATLATGLINALGSFSRSEWLLGVLDGRDLLTPDDLLAHLKRDEATEEQKQSAVDYDKSIAIYLRGHGNTKNVKDVAGETSGGLALLENRAIAPKVSGGGALQTHEAMSIDEIHAFALQYFAWVLSVKEAGKEKRREQAQARRHAEDSRKARSTNFWG